MASPGSTINVPPARRRVFLFMTATVAGVALFLCGVLVGQGTARRQGGGAGVVGAAAAFDRMRDEPRPAVLDVTSGEPSAAARNASDFTYPGRLDDPVPEAGAVGGPSAGPSPRSAAVVADSPADEPPAPLPPAAGRPAAAGAPDESVAAAAPDAVGPYTVQVTALQAAEAAEQVVGRLIAKGFPAYLHPPAPDAAVAMYRVRVGRYADRSRAEQVRRRLEQEEHFKPWITR